MAEPKQESCVSKIKESWSKIYNAPCFWLKTITYCVICFLVTIGLFTLVKFALDNFTEALAYSYMAPERLGQFGDFLGGTLNPIFGFATVCLLLWSVFIQRKELSLTRDELSKSATALNNQVKLATDEYNRKQLNEVLLELENAYEKIRVEGFETQRISYVDRHSMPSDSSVSCINDMLVAANKKNQVSTIEDLIERIYDPLNGDKYESIKIRTDKFLEITNKVLSIHEELLKVSHLTSIRINIQEKAKIKINNLAKISLISDDEKSARLSRIDLATLDLKQ